MLKKIKWLFLTLLIISLIITSVLFINFTKENKNNVNTDENYNDKINNEDNNSDDILKDIINKEWYINTLTISENEEEYFRSDSYNYKYIILDEETIKYCDDGKKCKEDNYTYISDMLSIKTDNTLGSGDYSVKYSEYELELSRKEENKTITYYFYLS